MRPAIENRWLTTHHAPMHEVLQPQLLAQFTCLGADCPDTCCRGWQMHVDAPRRARFAAEAPALLAAVDPATHAMKRHADGACVMLEDGLCGIQKRHGTDYVGDACHFYPRHFYRVGDTVFMAAALSCPETLRLLLAMESPLVTQATTLERLPNLRRIALPAGVSAAQATQVMAQAMAVAQDEAIAVEQAAAQSIALGFGRALPPARPQHSDAPKLLYALAVILARGDHYRHARLDETIATMEQALDCRIDWDTRAIIPGAHAAARAVALHARGHTASLAPLLRRYLAGQLALLAFPFGGFADATMEQNAVILAVRFATVRLALQCHRQGDDAPLDEATALRVIQSISRLLDHLKDAELSLLLYRDAGWLDLARLRALIGDLE